MNNFEIRYAKKEDADIIISLIKELADYEKLLDSVLLTKELLIENCFNKKYAEILLAFSDGNPIGYAIFFHNFSTFIGKPGIWLEDVYIKPEYRGKGYGKSILKFIANIALERDCSRFEWCVLDWNTPSIEFYTSIGANLMKEWLIERMDRNAIEKFVNSK